MATDTDLVDSLAASGVQHLLAPLGGSAGIMMSTIAQQAVFDKVVGLVEATERATGVTLRRARGQLEAYADDKWVKAVWAGRD